jgi:nucleoside-diphosphate-sugar epimerase
VLITGGSGHIGSAVARRVRALGGTPVLFDVRHNPANLHGLEDVTFVQGDIASFSDVATAVAGHGVGRVIHLGAVLTRESVAHPLHAIEVNAGGTANVLECARLFGVARVVWASSAAVYGQRSRYAGWANPGALDEDAPPIPEDLYAATKYLNEVLARQYRAAGLNVVGLRPVMTYGAGTFTTMVGILNEAIRCAALGGEARVTRPWQRDSAINPIFVDDCADLFAVAALREQVLSRDIYNTGTGEYLTIGAMMDIVSEVTGQRVVFEPEPLDAGDFAVPDFDFPDLDSGRLREELDWRPGHSFAQGVERLVAGYREAA